MRKTIVLAVIACILGIVLLAALAFYIPNRLGSKKDEGQSEVFTGFDIVTEKGKQADASRPGSEESPDTATGSLPNDTLPSSGQRDTVPSESMTEDAGPQTVSTLRAGTLPENVAEHQIIWVGDSRTLGLRDALHKSDRIDDDVFIGKVGEGVKWFREEGMSELSDAIEEYPDLPVVMNLGVNDPQLIGEYVTAYWDVIRAHPGTKFHILSVNPLDEEFLIEDGQVEEAVLDDINSLNVAKLNAKLKKEFGSRYLDSASYLKSDGFDTVDGLHFSAGTYLKIHDFVVSQLF